VDKGYHHPQAGLYGLATLNTFTGKVSLTLDHSLLAINKLTGGSTFKETFTVPDFIGSVKFQSAVSFSIKGATDGGTAGPKASEAGGRSHEEGHCPDGQLVTPQLFWPTGLDD
jgi:VCBS repeat-containing protein